MKPPVKPSWVIPLASFITMILAMVGDTVHPGINVDQAHIETLLMMLLGSGAIGAANSMHKRKTAVEKPKEDKSTDEIQEEIAEKVEEEVEKVKSQVKVVKEDIEDIVKKAVVKAVQNTPARHMTPKDFDELTEQQKEIALQTGTIVNPHMKETTGIKWNRMGHWLDHTLDSDPDKGIVMQYGEKYLYIKVDGAESGHTVRLSDDNDKVLQIDQQPKGGITRLVMKDFGGNPYARGKYNLLITAMGLQTSYSNTISTEFEIV